MHHPTPFALDAPLSPRLAAVLDYWNGLRRGGADIPFADDLDLAAAQALCDDVLVIGVFDRPQRFRLELARTPHAPDVQGDLQGRFLDDIAPAEPLDYLRAQASAAVESAAATCYRHASSGAGRRYLRLLLPMWGEGQVKLLLGAVDWQ